MNSVINTIAITRAESGDVLASIVCTHEANGCAIWYVRAGWAERLIAYHAFGLLPSRDGVVASALVHLQRLQKEAEAHGEGFVASRQFTQC